MSTTATRRLAARQVAAEERAARQQTIDQRAARLEAEKAFEQARRAREQAEARADRAEAEAQGQAPIVVMTYGDVQVRVHLSPNDDVTRQILAESVKRATRLLTGAFRAYVGRMRAEAMTGRQYPADPFETTLVARLNDELRLSINSGHVEVVRR
jgi:hypothetical protein